MGVVRLSVFVFGNWSSQGVVLRPGAKKCPKLLLHDAKSLGVAGPFSNPPRQLARNPLRRVALINEKERGVVVLVPNRATDALVHCLEAEVFIVPSRRARIISVASCDVLHSCVHLDVADVGEGKARDDDAARKLVGEVDALAQLRTHDADDQRPAVVHCTRVRCEQRVDVAPSPLPEDAAPGREPCQESGLAPPRTHFVGVRECGEKGDDARVARRDGADIEEQRTELIDLPRLAA